MRVHVRITLSKEDEVIQLRVMNVCGVVCVCMCVYVWAWARACIPIRGRRGLSRSSIRIARADFIQSGLPMRVCHMRGLFGQYLLLL